MCGNRREYHEGREVQGAIEEDPKPRYSDDMARWEVEIPTFAETCLQEKTRIRRFHTLVRIEKEEEKKLTNFIYTEGRERVLRGRSTRLCIKGDVELRMGERKGFRGVIKQSVPKGFRESGSEMITIRI